MMIHFLSSSSLSLLPSLMLRYRGSRTTFSVLDGTSPPSSRFCCVCAPHPPRAFRASLASIALPALPSPFVSFSCSVLQASKSCFADHFPVLAESAFEFFLLLLSTPSTSRSFLLFLQGRYDLFFLARLQALPPAPPPPPAQVRSPQEEERASQSAPGSCRSAASLVPPLLRVVLPWFPAPAPPRFHG